VFRGSSWGEGCFVNGALQKNKNLCVLWLSNLDVLSTGHDVSRYG
jgi:hypothetical protein